MNLDQAPAWLGGSWGPLTPRVFILPAQRERHLSLPRRVSEIIQTRN